MSEDVLSIQSAIISDPTGTKVFEIENSISDMEIFEHLDKPYLTGTVSFLDTVGVLDRIRFKGVERFEVSLKFPYDDRSPVTKTFIIDKILNTTKNNDKVELVTFHIIEEIAFISTFLNVNKAYEGSGRGIIEKIFSDYFEEYTLSQADEDEMIDNVKLIVPNMTPLEACNWIKDRTTSTAGTPYYLFSTLSNKKKVHFLPLSTMLSGRSKSTYIYSRSLTGMDDPKIRPYIIEDYRVNRGGDLSSLINKSLMGAEYSFIDTSTGDPRTIKFDSLNRFRLTEQLKDLSGGEFIYNNDYLYKGKKINEIASRKTFMITTGHTYLNHRNFRELPSNSNAVWSKALRDIVTTNPIDIAVSGQTFLDPQVNRSIGNLINILFLNNDIQTETSNIDDSKDKVKSGRHLVYAARHIIRKEKYDVVLSCVKLENLK